MPSGINYNSMLIRGVAGSLVMGGGEVLLKMKNFVKKDIFSCIFIFKVVISVDVLVRKIKSPGLVWFKRSSGLTFTEKNYVDPDKAWFSNKNFNIRCTRKNIINIYNFS